MARADADPPAIHVHMEFVYLQRFTPADDANLFRIVREAEQMVLPSY